MNINKCYDKSSSKENVLYNDYGLMINMNKLSSKISRKEIFATNQSNYSRKKVK